MKALSILGVVFAVTFGRVAFLYLESRAAYRRRARPSGSLKAVPETHRENLENATPSEPVKIAPPAHASTPGLPGGQHSTATHTPCAFFGSQAQLVTSLGRG
jgi:hypothetical protein